jgi:hypothetical protein
MDAVENPMPNDPCWAESLTCTFVIVNEPAPYA